MKQQNGAVLRWDGISTTVELAGEVVFQLKKNAVHPIAVLDGLVY